MDSRLRTILILVAVGLLGYYLLWGRNSGTSSSSPAPQAAVPSPAARGAPERFVTVRSGALEAQVSTYSGAIRRWRLTAPQFANMRVTDGNAEGISTTWREPAYPLRSNIRFTRDDRPAPMPDYLTFEVERQSDTDVELVARIPEAQLEVRRTIRAHTNYAFMVNTRVTNLGAPGRVEFSQGVYHWIRRDQEAGKFFAPSWQVSEGFCYHRGDLDRRSREDMGKVGERNDGVSRHAGLVGTANQYFATALIPQEQNVACHLRAEDYASQPGGEPTGSLMFAQLSWPAQRLAQGETRSYRVVSYFGPKYSADLTAASPMLRDVLNLGTFAFIARGLLWYLRTLYRFVGNWGLAIILLTLTVRTLLYPILHRSTKSLAVMQKLKPEIDAINERFKDEQEAKGLAMMELYRKHKVNPVAGCVPQLAQLPVWWALYTTLQTSVELFHARFALWWTDLSAPDPYFVLPLVLGAVMFLQQKLMPPSMPDPVQAKIMLYFLPIFLTGISLFLPAGLALYMLVNSILAIIQQKITKMQIDRMSSDPSGIEVRPAVAVVEGPKDPPPGNRSDGGRRGNRR